MTKIKLTAANRLSGLPRTTLALLIAAPLAAQAQPTQETGGDAGERATDLGSLVVTSTRRDQTLSDIPRSVRVFDGEELENLQAQTNSVQEILGKLIPGFAPPVTEGSAGSLTLRGRAPLFLIDGVPIASNTNFSRYLDKFDPMTIDRIEVVYGPTALYGAGATGGVIQFFTKPANTDSLKIEAGSQLRAYVTGEDNFDSDSQLRQFYASVSGPVNDRLSVYGYASYADTGGVARAEGDLLPGRSQFVDDISFLGKARLQMTEAQALTLTLNATELDYQDASFEFSRSIADDGTVIAARNPAPLSYAEPPTNEFFFASLDYAHEDVLGGRVSAQLYYSESEFLNPASDIRPLLMRFGGPFPDFFPGLWQTGRITDEFGLRTQFSRQFDNGLNITVGLDYNDAESDSLLPISSEADFDQTLFLDAAVRAQQTPPYTLDATGLFVEAGMPVTDRVSLSAGLRWDEFDYEVIGPYDVVFTFQPGERPGGSGSSDDISWNTGINFDLTDRTVLFANYSEGFTIPSLGFIGNNVPPGVPVSDSRLVEPIITESIEVGIRGNAGPLQFAAAAYTTDSDFSTAIGVDPATGLAVRDRAPIDIYGVEASVLWNVNDRFSVESAITWVEGEVDPNNDGNELDVTTQDVPPVKFWITPRYQITSKWSIFGQLFYVADRDEAFEDGTDPAPVESYTLFDLGSSYRYNDNFDVGLQITNLFNREYIPAGEASFIPGRVFSGPGRAVTLNLDFRF
ncbi:MAG: TonB-dependent receptor [Pseudomonadota bacterium]